MKLWKRLLFLQSQSHQEPPASLVKYTTEDNDTDSTLTCADPRGIGEGTESDYFDIGFSLDTTASMGSAVAAISTKIASFADTLTSNNVNVRFAGITVGDAFATMNESGSAFQTAVAAGPLGTPPSFDSSERPWSGSTVLTADDADDADDIYDFFTEVASVVGTGSGGGDLPENYLGSLEYLNDNVSWREGAGRVLISIGDDCAHTPTTADYAGITDSWMPPSGTELEQALTGVATVHVIGESYCSGDYYSMQDLATATGGTFTEFDCYSSSSCNVDLEALPITDSITQGYVYDCDGSESFFDAAGTYTLTFGFTVEASDGETYNATVVMVITLTLA